MAPRIFKSFQKDVSRLFFGTGNIQLKSNRSVLIWGNQLGSDVVGIGGIMLGPQVVEICRQGKVSIDTANERVAVIWRFTKTQSQLVDRLIAQLEAVNHDQLDRVNELETEINDLINRWHSKIRKLGGCPKGLWMADFDSGDGYFSWKFPEREILYWRPYEDGFADRMPVEKWLRRRNLQATAYAASILP